MADSFYRAFEDRYRGSRELIKSRLEAYRPFIEPLAAIHPQGSALDLGCGRGEWLEVLQSAGLSPFGVDLDEGMLAACAEGGLHAIQGDALAYLSSLADESQVVVSAFHVVEHISFEQLRHLVAEALRVLVPGGILVIETPNPENIVVATRNFYLDPTHVRPIPPELLSFLPDYYGFGRVKTLRMQESPDLLGSDAVSLNAVFSGVSPDYAVIAQKKGEAPDFVVLDSPFAKEYGLTLETLSSRYDSRIEERLVAVEGALQDADMRVEQAEARARQAEGRAEQAEGRAEWAERRAEWAEARVAKAEGRAERAEGRVERAETRTQQAEARTQQAEAGAQQAEAGAQQAEVGAQQAEVRAQQAEVRAQQAEVRAQQAEVRADEAEARAHQAEVRTERAEGRAQRGEWTEARAAKAEAEVVELTRRLQAAERATDDAVHESYEWHRRVLELHQSTSWRVTSPLRVAKRALGGDPLVYAKARSTVFRTGKRLVRPAVVGTMNIVLGKPRLRKAVAAFLRNHYPAAYGRLRALRGRQETSQENTPQSRILHVDGLWSALSPYAGKKVAVLAPAAVDGTLGGAERFHEGLVNGLREMGCEVDLIYKVFDESTFEAIKQGYEDFAALDLSPYDLVVSTKAPTYVVNHPNHVMYLQHTIRAFYDMFDVQFPHADAAMRERRAWIHRVDTEAFGRIGITGRFSQAHEVSRRLRAWNNCDAEVLYPEIVVDGLHDSGIGDYFFLPGRLHHWKRVDLAVKAVLASSLPMRLVISGTGPEESALRKLGGNDPRIEFVGRVDDARLKELYANALAVPFVPIREDYGYVTLEAFACGKPVVTCVDSGEPVEFVADGVTGFVCQPDPQSLSAAFETLWNDRDLAARMGKAGRERTADIKWPKVVRRLLEAGFPDIKASPPATAQGLKVAVLDMQPIIPAVGGGRLRLLGLYHALGPTFQVRYVGTYDWPGEKYRRHRISATLEEIDVPLSPKHFQAAADAARRAGGKTVIDLLFGRQAHLSPAFLEETFDAVKWADVVIFSHPWVSPLVADELLAGKTVIYDSQNVEQRLRGQLLDVRNPFEREVLDEVARDERAVGDRSDLVLACSQEDVEGFSQAYGWEPSRMRLVPNGVFARNVVPAGPEEKLVARRALGVPEDIGVGFFIGSEYGPNVEAGQFIVERLAPELPEVMFCIGGGVCNRLPTGRSPNVRVIGFLEESDKQRWLHASDFAINPMFSGSGTNIKMFDFMAAGLPVVTTPVGGRGIAQESSAGLRIAEGGALAEEIRGLLRDRDAALRGGQENRHMAETRWAWESISPDLGTLVRSAHRRKQGRAILTDPVATSRLRVAHVSTIGLTCGIGEYARNVVDVYRKHGIENLVLTARAGNEEPDLTTLEVPAHVVWFFDNVTWNASSIGPEAVTLLKEWKATNLILHYHPGFFSGRVLVEFVREVIHEGIAVAIVLHTIDPVVMEALRALNHMGAHLIAHRMTQVIAARGSGIELELLPLAMDAGNLPSIRSIEGRDWVKKPPTIVTTGFLRSHKGLRTLIQAMPAIIARFPGAKLCLRCSLYPSEDSRGEHEACMAEVDRLGIAESVVFDTRFLDKGALLDALAPADLAVLPYDRSNEGGSASATDCIAVGLPLIVSDAEIFDEIREVTVTTIPAAEAVSRAVIAVLSDSERYGALAARIHAYAEANSWPNLAGALLV